MQKSQTVLKAIESFFAKEHYYPSCQQLSGLTGMCKASVHKYIRLLEKEGKIKRNPRGSVISHE